MIATYSQSKNESLAFKNNRITPQILVFKPYDAAYQLYSGFMLVQKANAGDPFAQHELGIRYLTGEGFQQDTTKSFFWIQKSAEQNLPAAQYNLGIFLNNGWSVNWNPYEAFKYFLASAKQDMPQAQYVVGLTYTENLIVRRNLFKAYGWIKKSANLGFEPSKELLTEFERRGIKSEFDSSLKNDNVKSNSNQNSHSKLLYIDFTADTSYSVNDSVLIEDLIKGGGKFFDEQNQKEKNEFKNYSSIIKIKDSLKINSILSSANCGNPEALTLLGKIFEKGIIFKKDLIRSASYYIRATILESYRSSRLLWELMQDKNFIVQLKNGIDKNNSEAKFVLSALNALKFDNSIGEKDIIKLLKEGADINNINSINYLALCYYTGNFVEKDKSSAIKLWNKASDLGNEEALIRLIMFNISEKTKSNEDIILLKKYEEKGSILAEYSLAYCYEIGFGVEKNIGIAVHYFRKSAFRGSTGAYETLKKLYDELRPKEKEFEVE